MRHAKTRPWVLFIFGIPALVRGSLMLRDEPSSGWAIATIVAGVVISGVAVLRWWNLRSSPN